MPNTVTTTSTTSTTSTAIPDAERADLLSALAAARSALIKTTEGLSDEQAGERPTVSALCLGGLVKHVTSVEESWLRFAAEGPRGMNFDLPDGVTWDDIMAGTAREVPQWMVDHQAEFRLRPGEALSGILARYEQVAARSEEIIASLPDLSTTYLLPDAPWQEPGTSHSVRWALVHVITETAHHAGHAKALREALDGRRSG
ncbi:DinB family protein [Saccharothrix xinjiangensis]|uniref:DinB family protein n=1 Tax=Saccharothrix xinjiangensis TaxID=204798 RepID=A0ABV9Y2Y6_9PSEU